MKVHVAGSGLEHTDLETMILTRYHLRHPAIVFDAAKIRFFCYRSLLETKTPKRVFKKANMKRSFSSPSDVFHQGLNISVYKVGIRYVSAMRWRSLPQNLSLYL